MKNKIKIGLVLGVLIASISYSFFCGSKITVYHKTSSGNWQVISIDQNTRFYHAAHGDLWYSTLCPLGQAETACR